MSEYMSQFVRRNGSAGALEAWSEPTTDNGRHIRDFHLVDGRSWARSQQTSDGGYESIFVANRHDTTRVYLGYESRCGWCWLGAGHSEAAHSERTDRCTNATCLWTYAHTHAA